MKKLLLVTMLAGSVFAANTANVSGKGSNHNTKIVNEKDDSGRFKEIIQDDSFVLLKTWEPEIHKLSHRNISAVFFRIKIQNISATLQNDYLCIQREALREYAVSRLTEKYLNFLHIFADL